MKISAVTIMYNEELLVADYINHIKDSVDEVVIVDGGSTDSSVQIAQSLGAKVVIKHQPPDMSTFSFGAQWSYAMNQASGEWLFIISTDERICDEFKKELKSIVNTVPAGVDSLKVLRFNYIDGQPYAPAFRESHIRIVKNTPQIRYSSTQKVHESLDYCVKNTIMLKDLYYIKHDKSKDRFHKQSVFYNENFYQRGKR